MVIIQIKIWFVTITVNHEIKISKHQREAPKITFSNGEEYM